MNTLFHLYPFYSVYFSVVVLRAGAPRANATKSAPKQGKNRPRSLLLVVIFDNRIWHGLPSGKRRFIPLARHPGTGIQTVGLAGFNPR